MRFSVKSLLLVITLAAFFLAGWMGHHRFGDSYANKLAAEKWKELALQGYAKPNATDPNVLSIPRKLEGVVTGQDNGFVAISLGTDDGVRVGHNIDIYRGKRFVGRAVVTTCESNRSAARLPPEFQATEVREGDYVSFSY